MQSVAGVDFRVSVRVVRELLTRAGSADAVADADLRANAKHILAVETRRMAARAGAYGERVRNLMEPEASPDMLILLARVVDAFEPPQPLAVSA